VPLSLLELLEPATGAFSADTWTLVATVVRNIVLNWLVLLPLLAAVLVTPRILFALVGEYPDFPFAEFFTRRLLCWWPV